MKILKDNSAGGLNRLFLTMTILPIIVMGIFIISVDCGMYSNGLQAGVRNELYAAGQSVLIAYDQKYPGDYNLLVNEDTGEQFLKKGDVIIDDDTAIIDSLEGKTGIDISLFFYDTRMLTTIKDQEGMTVVGSVAHKNVVDKVLVDKQESFYDNMRVADKDYFALYIPVLSQKGVCVGMIGVAKPTEVVKAYIGKAMLQNALLIVLALLVVTFVVKKCTGDIVRVLSRLQKFMGEMSEGNLNNRIDDSIVSRSDEIGEMGRFTEHVQASLRKLIERDALTGLYNRRSGMNKIAVARDKCKIFSVAMGDIDFFKKVNDTYGHDAGDEVLRVVSRIIGDAMVGNGFVARWGGEEFLMVFEEMDAATAAKKLWEILETIRGTTVISGEYEIKVTMSYGVTLGDMKQDIDDQIKRADNGLYYSKTHGRNQVTEYDLLNEEEIEEHPDNTCKK